MGWLWVGCQGLHLLSDLSAPFLPLLTGCVRDFHEEAGSAGITCLAFDMQPPQDQVGSWLQAP